MFASVSPGQSSSSMVVASGTLTTQRQSVSDSYCSGHPGTVRNCHSVAIVVLNPHVAFGKARGTVQGGGKDEIVYSVNRHLIHLKQT